MSWIDCLPAGANGGVNMAESAAIRAVCIMGPTAAGKTRTVMELAERFAIDVISVDSALVYRGMDIGTAKPSPAELRRVPHRLIDICAPHEAYSAGAFCRDVAALLPGSCAAGRLPVLAGGTMLYFQALQQGLADLPAADPKLRAELDSRAAEHGWPALHAELQQLDAATAARLRPNDAQRIQRALEVCLLAGEPMSVLQQQTRPPVRAEYLNIGLLPADRAVLHARIEARLEAMLAGGLIDEVARIAGLPGVTDASPALRAVGYRQFLPHVRGEISREEAFAKAVVATRRLAKRQMTWLRSWPDLHVVDSLNADCGEQVANLIREWQQC